MAVEYTDRLGVARWPSGSDPFTRDQMNTSHEALEERAATFLSGPIADRPSVGDGTVRMFYLSLDENTPYGILYYCDLVDDNSGQLVWVAINNAAAPESLAPGDAQDEGTSGSFSRSDHVHDMLPWGQTSDIANVSTSKAGGAAEAYARADHVHQLGANSVTSSAIASGAISSSGQIAAGVVGTTQLASNAVTRAKIDASQRIPSGAIMPFVSGTAPVGWLVCDGSLVSQSSYADLFAVVGSSFAIGNETVGKFRLPDLRYRIPVGSNTMANVSPEGAITAPTGSMSASIVGTTGGTTDVALVSGNLPGHTHSMNHDHPSFNTGQGGNHRHDQPVFSSLPNNPNPYGVSAILGFSPTRGFFTDFSTHSHDIDVPAFSGNTGSNQVGSPTSFSIVQPYLTLTYIIKT